MKELMKGKEIDMESAKENLSWVTNVLWDVHRLAQDQFILRTQDQTNQWLENVYRYVVARCIHFMFFLLYLSTHVAPFVQR